jgi:hypothetical protein
MDSLARGVFNLLPTMATVAAMGLVLRIDFGVKDLVCLKLSN